MDAASTGVQRVGDAVQRIAGLGLIVVTLVAAQDLPRWGTLLFAGASVYLLVLIRWPRLWLLLLPGLCVVVDLAPWTGRFLYNELDVFFWLTIAAALSCARYGLVPGAWVSAAPRQRLGAILVGLFAAVVLVRTTGLSAVLDPPGAAVVSPYLDPAYGYKVAKGMLWGLLLAPLWLELRRDAPGKTMDSLFLGAAMAALGLFVVILWERGTLAALGDGLGSAAASFLDLQTYYRTIGLFSDMHTGGEALDGTIIVLLVVTAYGALFAGSPWRRRLSLLAAVALVYVTLVGFTRATYAAFAFALALAVAVELYRARGRWGLSAPRVLLLSALLPAYFAATYLAAQAASSTTLLWLLFVQALILYIAVPRGVASLAHLRVIIPLLFLALPLIFALGLTAERMGERMQGVERDLETRRAHWSRVLDLAARTPGGELLGHGAGRFPALYQETFPMDTTWIGRFAVDAPGVLQLQGGGDLLVYQRVPARLRVLSPVVYLRAPRGGRLAVEYCSRNILDTGWWRGRCDSQMLVLPPSRTFEAYAVTLALPVEARTGEAAGWPRALQLRALTRYAPIEVAGVEVPALPGVLSNADFAHGLDHWFFSTDFGHLPFHIKNVWLQFWFDHGLVGSLFILLLLGLLARRAPGAPPASPFLPLAGVCTVSVVVLGLFGTPLDSARMSWWFYLLLFAGVLEPAHRAPAVPAVQPRGARP